MDRHLKHRSQYSLFRIFSFWFENISHMSGLFLSRLPPSLFYLPSSSLPFPQHRLPHPFPGTELGGSVEKEGSESGRLGLARSNPNPLSCANSTQDPGIIPPSRWPAESQDSLLLPSPRLLQRPMGQQTYKLADRMGTEETECLVDWAALGIRVPWLWIFSFLSVSVTAIHSPHHPAGNLAVFY